MCITLFRFPLSSDIMEINFDYYIYKLLGTYLSLLSYNWIDGFAGSLLFHNMWGGCRIEES